MRILCLDIGKVRIGVAISDQLNLIAQPLMTIDLNKADFFTELEKLIRDYKVEKIVVGYPLNKTHPHEKNEKLVELDSLVEQIKKKFGMEIIKWDERFSTKAVDRILSKDLNWKKKKKVIDKIAATYILQGYLDFINSAN